MLLFYENPLDNLLKHNEKKHLVFPDLFFIYNQNDVLLDLVLFS